MGDGKSFIIDPSIIGEKNHLNTSFTVGQINKEKGFVHIMNEISLEVLMSELDTVSDFVTYLLEKERFILSGQLYKAYSEEDLLTAYLENVDDEEKHSFKFDNKDLKIEIEKNIWLNHKNSDGYFFKKIEDKVSYIWDSMINRTTYEMLNQRLVEQSLSNPLELEKVLKIMASENRLNRRSLSKTFLDLFEKYKSLEKENLMLKRTIILVNSPYKIYVFLITNKPESLDYESYQNKRKFQLLSYMISLKSKYTEVLDIVGISREASMEIPASNDFVYLNGREWTKEDQIEAEKNCYDFKHLEEKNIQRFSKEEIEYPYS
jgi:hypothetical protein